MTTSSAAAVTMKVALLEFPFHETGGMEVVWAYNATIDRICAKISQSPDTPLEAT